MRLLCGHNTRDRMVAIALDNIVSIELEENCIEVWDNGGKCTQFIKPTGFYNDDFIKLLHCISGEEFSIVITKYNGLQKLGTDEGIDL